jgi:hypothetical protein
VHGDVLGNEVELRRNIIVKPEQKLIARSADTPIPCC